MSEYRLPVSLRGTVSHGDKRGRVLGFPTANLNGETPCAMDYGVYASTTRIPGRDRTYRSVTSYGTRPTFDGFDTRIETHILDFNEDIYGQEIEVELVAFIRPELRFTTVDSLIEAIHGDIDTVRSITEQTCEQGRGPNL
jgi:riboflavin kinase/FMN adenylyltransferase